jgi:preprotein translocase subunit SecE
MLKSTKVYKFYEQVRQEAYKVVWPNKKELMVSTAVVMGAVFVCSLVCLVLDYSLHGIVQYLLAIGR